MTGTLCVGHACYDVLFSMDGFPVENAKYAVAETRESSGGPACNAASLLGLWGLRCVFAGLVGRDHYGERVAAELAAAGVDTAMLELRDGHPTPLSFIIVNRSGGSRTIINRKSPETLPWIPPEAFRDTWTGESPGILLFDGHEPEASLAALETFPDALSVLDAGSLRRGTEILSRRVDYCIASERFARDLLGGRTAASGTAEAALEEMGRRGARFAAITLGERGCIYRNFLSGACPGRIPALPVRAVDTTAAGDIFHGAFVFALMESLDFVRGLVFASAAAGLSVEKPGGRESIPGLAETRLAARRLEALLEDS